MKSKEQELLDKLDPSTDETDVRSFADVVKGENFKEMFVLKT